MNKLDHDTRIIELSEKAISKSDKDIATISALNKFAQKTGNILVLTGGYAVEALCGGKITRAHGDIDAHIILTGTKSNEELFGGVQDLLFKEDTRWILRDQKQDKVDYLEDDERKEFFDRRRVEVRLNLPHEANVKYPKKKLIDSQGNTIEIGIIDLTEITSGKIHKFFELKNGVDTTEDRHSSESDYFDLKRLLALSEFDKSAINIEEYNYAKSLIENH
jgi:hypothetical protein